MVLMIRALNKTQNILGVSLALYPLPPPISVAPPLQYYIYCQWIKGNVKTNGTPTSL